jgi:hypothetical protein
MYTLAGFGITTQADFRNVIIQTNHRELGTTPQHKFYNTTESLVRFLKQ